MLSSLINRLGYLHFISFSQAMVEMKEGVKNFLEDILFWEFVLLLPRAIVRFAKAVFGLLVFLGGINIVLFILSSGVVVLATILVVSRGLNGLSDTGVFLVLQAIRYFEIISMDVYVLMSCYLSVASFIIWWNMRKAAKAANS